MGKTLEELLALYKCHKVVKAVKVLEVHDYGTTDEAQGHPLVTVVSATGYRQRLRLPLPPEYNRSVLVPGCYYVVYEDGYASISPANAFEEGYVLLNSDQKSITITLAHDDPDPMSTVAKALNEYRTSQLIPPVECAWDAAPDEFWEKEKVQHILTTKLSIKRVIGTTEDGFGKVRLDSGEVAVTGLKATTEHCIVYNPEMRVAFVRPVADIGPVYKLNLNGNI